ncbi:MAG: beta-propeller domain-containing protein [Ruminococcus sp.]|nr:beta-propeller domain-containing protein [Ruminococcus sp.]
MRENDEKLRDMLTSEEVPEQLSPENIKVMLDEKAPKKRRSGISVAGRIAAGAAACAVIAGSYAGTAQLMKARKNSDSPSVSTLDGKGKTRSSSKTVRVDAPYMNGAESYDEVYELMETASKKWEREQKRRERSNITGGFFKKDADYAINEESAEYAAEEGVVYDGAPATNGGDESVGVPTETTGTPEHSDTYDQEEGVREADIVKTDGNNIYYLWNERVDYYYDEKKAAYVNSFDQNFPKMNIASVKDGEFIDSTTIDLTPDLSGFEIQGRFDVTVNDMYIYNDMIEVIGSVGTMDSYYYGQYNQRAYYIDENGDYHPPVSSTFVSFYTKGDEPELIGTYFQDGWYNDVRIAPDGCMYLISTYNTVDFNSVEDKKNIERYIPCCGTDDEIECIPPEDVLLPIQSPDAKTLLSYTVISGIDLNESGEFTVVDNKALAGFTGTIYSSAENIYAAVQNGSDSDITRIAFDGGNIEPMASGTVEGYVKDQFSMSEYDGYFRIATTINKFHDNSSIIGDIFNTNEPSYTERNNAVTVLDMDMNTVGKIKDFGVDEQIKSVNFSGDIAYVVTFRQTDPLFAIDLSDPTEPAILDEFKINGFSTYMQKWSDGLLLGFGVDADDSGRTSGVKVVMFDNSDPNDLKEVGIERINIPDGYVYSTANYERKALLIAPEKNLIGFPITINDYTEYDEENAYVFYSYEDGEFVKRGELSVSAKSIYGADRALYIGDYVYIMSSSQFVSADIENIEYVDSVDFE